jgi:chemotaxis protein MotA
MDIFTLVGILLGFGAMILANILEGGNLGSLIQVSAAIIVFGGTFGATFIAFPKENIVALPKVIMKAFFEAKLSPESTIKQLTGLADKARREGLLSLESESNQIDDPFLKKGIELVVDGSDPEIVGDTLRNELYVLEKRHKGNFAVLESMGGFAPTMGVIGTVMGLVNVLSHLEDPSRLGESIAVAFVATLYGVASANLLYLPLANKLKEKSQGEQLIREMMVEGIMSLQAGENPRVIEQKLLGYLSPGARNARNKAEGVAAGVE